MNADPSGGGRRRRNPSLFSFFISFLFLLLLKFEIAMYELLQLRCGQQVDPSWIYCFWICGNGQVSTNLTRHAATIRLWSYMAVGQ